MAIALSIGQLEGWVAQGFFPFTRIGACLMVAPVFGARFVPPRTRVILAVAITALVATSGFFLPFQSTIYQAIQQELEGRLFSHRQVRSVAVMYGVLTLAAVCLSVPLWHLMGLL